MRVRVVDDSRDLASLFSQVLSDIPDIEIHVTTTDFTDLLTDAPWEGVDVALVDMMLPKVSGLSILTYLANEHPQIRRVAATASLQAAQDALTVANRVLVKPCSIETLVEAVTGASDG